MSYVAKSKQVKQIGRLLLVFDIFNINEPIIFGLSIMLNAYMIISFILVTVVCVLITYFGMHS